MLGYVNDTEKTSNSYDEEGWYKSGDVGYYTDDGCIYIIGRIRELMFYNHKRVGTLILVIKSYVEIVQNMSFFLKCILYFFFFFRSHQSTLKRFYWVTRLCLMLEWRAKSVRSAICWSESSKWNQTNTSIPITFYRTLTVRTVHNYIIFHNLNVCILVWGEFQKLMGDKYLNK